MLNTCRCLELITAVSEENIQAVEKILEKHADHPSAWKTLYRCSICGQFWEKSYPAAGDVCCVEPEFHKIKIENYIDEYGLNR